MLLVATAVLLAGGLAVVSRGSPGKGGQAVAAESSASAPPQVPVAEVVTRTIVPSTEFTGHFAAPRTVELRSRVSGAIEAVSVPEGRLVRKGQLLFQIDPRPFQVAVDTAAAQLRQAEVLLAQARADLERAQRLAPSGAVSRKVHDDAQSRLHERQAQVQAAKAALAAAQLDLSYAQVRAPIAGRVDRVMVTEGNLVSGGNTGAATLLTTIVSVDPMHVYFDIDESTYLGFSGRAAAEDAKARWPVRVGLANEQGFPHEGLLDFLGNRVDRSTGTVRARAVIPNPQGRLAPGLFARATLATGAAQQAVLIDDQAVGTDQGRNYVLLLGAQNKVEYRPVELGPVVDGLRVVRSGLRPGETIVLKGLVRPGMQVTPQPVAMAASQGAQR